MAIINVEQSFTVGSFNAFLKKMNLESNSTAGDDGTDEELIRLTLETMKGNWICTVIEDHRVDDYFFNSKIIVR